MLGAMIGDVVGSPYEFDQGAKTTEFPLFVPESSFTDDSVMTAAVGQAMLDADGDERAFGAALVARMREFYQRYPNPKGSYGARFHDWLRSPHPEPYGSFGNGSAMRVAAVGWLGATEVEVLRWAELSAAVTHNHPEGIRGAQAVAWAIWRARTLGGAPAAREQLRQEVAVRFGYDLSRSVDDIRPGYHHQESCQATVPEALTCYFEATSFEEALRLAVSLGGDTDTVAAITGSVAEAGHGIPSNIARDARARVPEDLLAVADAVHRRAQGL